MKTPTHVFTRTGSAANEWAIDDDVVRLQEWGTDKSHVLPLPPTNECTVGAAAVCAIRLEDPSHLVSRLHARLIRGETGWLLRDEGSKNGVRIDGARRSEIMLAPDRGAGRPDAGRSHASRERAHGAGDRSRSLISLTSGAARAARLAATQFTTREQSDLCTLITISREVLLATGSTDTRIEESTPIDFDAVLGDVLGAAQRTFPTFCLPPDVFVAYLRERLPPDLPPPIALRRMHTSDLYLACACAHGHADAIAVLDERCLGQIDRALSKIGIDRDVIAEVKQEIRYRVLVGGGGHAEIVDFSGRGDLRRWIRVMATRQALRRQGRARREMATEDDELWQHLASFESPELDHMKEFYRQEFRRAFEIALRALPHREQTLLRQHYLDGATLDELARLYRVHRTTVARMLGPRERAGARSDAQPPGVAARGTVAGHR